MDKQRTQEYSTSRGFYDRICRVYDSIADPNELKARELGENALRLRANESVLEVGFGTGSSLVQMARCVAPSGRVCGIDVSSGMMRVANEKVSQAGLDVDMDLREGDVLTGLPWSDETFAAALLSFTLEAFGDDEMVEVLSEVRRVLVDGGRVSVVSMSTLPNGGPDSVLVTAYKRMRRHFAHILGARPVDVFGSLSAAGFEVVSEARMEVWTVPVAIVLAKKSDRAAATP